jgi:hypothetical protein
MRSSRIPAGCSDGSDGCRPGSRCCSSRPWPCSADRVIARSGENSPTTTLRRVSRRRRRGWRRPAAGSGSPRWRRCSPGSAGIQVTPGMAGAFLAGLRLVSWDATMLDVADSQANTATFITSRNRAVPARSRSPADDADRGRHPRGDRRRPPERRTGVSHEQDRRLAAIRLDRTPVSDCSTVTRGRGWRCGRLGFPAHVASERSGSRTATSRFTFSQLRRRWWT